MKKYRRTLLFTTALCITSASIAEAGILTVNNKIPDQRIQLFIRGEGSDTYQIQLVEAGEAKSFGINKEHVQGKNTFEVTASTGNGGDPDWKLLGGTCSNLFTEADHIISIDSTLGKISCTNITADNPVNRRK